VSPAVRASELDTDWSGFERQIAALAPAKVRQYLKVAASRGAMEGARVTRAAAHRGSAEPPSQWYRKVNARHGSFRGSVRFAEIHAENRPGTVGYVWGPMGFFGASRHWLEFGTAAHGIPARKGGAVWRLHRGADAVPSIIPARAAAVRVAYRATVQTLEHQIARLTSGR